MLIEADRVEVDEAKSTSVYLGHVQVDQGTMRLTADHVTVYHRDDRRIRHIVALGVPASYKQLLDGDQGEVQAFSRRMDYDADKDELILTEQAVLIQGGDRIASERIVYDRAKARMRAGGSGRVKIVIEPQQHQDGGAKAAPAAAQTPAPGPARAVPPRPPQGGR
jgi:lipopolysaccharide export system protein LptA